MGASGRWWQVKLALAPPPWSVVGSVTTCTVHGAGPAWRAVVCESLPRSVQWISALQFLAWLPEEAQHRKHIWFLFQVGHTFFQSIPFSRNALHFLSVWGFLWMGHSLLGSWTIFYAGCLRSKLNTSVLLTDTGILVLSCFPRYLGVMTGGGAEGLKLGSFLILPSFFFLYFWFYPFFLPIW